MGFTALALLLALAPADDPLGDRLLAVITVDAAGSSVGDVPVEWHIEELWSRRAISAVGSGFASFDDERAWNAFAHLQESGKTLRVQVRTSVPYGSNSDAAMVNDANRRMRLVVEPLRFVDCAVTDARGRSVVDANDVWLHFDDGTTRMSFASDHFACRDGRIRVPLPRAKFDTIRVRATRESACSPWFEVASSSSTNDVLTLELASTVTLTGLLRAPSGEPLVDESVWVIPSIGALPTKCARPGSIRQTTTSDRSNRVINVIESFYEDHREATTIQTRRDGSFSMLVPFGGSIPDTLRFELHRQYGRCWIADAALDPSVTSGTIDAGAIPLIADPRAVCGRVVDDRGVPIPGVDVNPDPAIRPHGGERTMSMDDTLAVPSDRTDAHGRFRMDFDEPTAFVASKHGYTSSPPTTLVPGTDEAEIRVTRCATVHVACVPSATLFPEAFELRWRGANASGAVMLHSWTHAFDAIPAGPATFEVVLRADDRTPLVSRSFDADAGGSHSIDCDVSRCGRVTLRVRTDGGSPPSGVYATIADSGRVALPTAGGTLRIEIRTPSTALTISARGCSPVSGVYGHGTHDVVLTRLD